MRQLRSAAREFQAIMVTALLVAAKGLVLQYLLGTGVRVGEVGAASAALMLLLTCWIVLLPPAWRYAILGLFNVSLTVLFLADLLFFRYYGTLAPFAVLYQSGQISGVWRSVVALLQGKDLLLLSDWLVLGPYLIWERRRLSKVRQLEQMLSRANPEEAGLPLSRRQRLGPRSQRGRRLTPRARWIGSLSILALSLASLGFSAKRLQVDYGRAAFSELYSNDVVLDHMGALAFHLVDVATHLQPAPDGALPVGQLRQWEAIHQRREAGGRLRGAAAGANVILVQLESMQSFVIGKSLAGREITPNLNRLRESSLYFDNYFAQVAQGNTADAEFMAMNSLYPAPAGAAFVLHDGNTYQALPQLLKQQGYKGAYVLHPFTPDYWNRSAIYPRLGIDRFFSQGDYTLDDSIGMGLSDQSAYRQDLARLEQMPQPFFALVISLSAHHPFNIPRSKQGLIIPDGSFSTTFTNYLQAQHYADQALGELLDGLKRDGLLDRSLLVVYGDHFGFGWTMEDLQGFLGLSHPLTAYDSAELNKVPLFIRLPGGVSAGTEHISGGQMDLLPTVANLVGLPKDRLFYFGRDLLNVDRGFTAFRRYLPEGSYATDEVLYIAADDGVFEHGAAFNRVTGQPLPLAGLKADSNRARWELHMSDLILQQDGIPRLLPTTP